MFSSSVLSLSAKFTTNTVPQRAPIKANFGIVRCGQPYSYKLRGSLRSRCKEVDAMAASSKFDPSRSPDKPPYASGPRGPYAGASLDRSGSFRESLENPILSSLPSMSRRNSAVDVVKFFHGLRYDPKAPGLDHKFDRQGEIKKAVSAALGLSQDDSPSVSSKGKLLSSPATEEVRKVKAGLRESSSKARDRAKMFGEAFSALSKCFPNISTRKRSRIDVSGDRSVSDLNTGKMAITSHTTTKALEVEKQRLEEKTKNAVTNKRTRTSLSDARVNSFARPSGLVDKDRDVSRFANSGAVLAEDRTLSIGLDGWEKSKMKKKRSVIKPDSSLSTMSSKLADRPREPKQGLQQRLVSNSRAKSNDSYAVRSGAGNSVGNGAVGVGKSEGILQETGSGVRVSIPRAELENSSGLSDKKDRSIESDKERVNPKSLIKAAAREECASPSPTSNVKLTASARAPRSSGSATPKLSAAVQRTPGDWDITQCSRPPTAAGVNNRKRTPSARSSSPPVARWAGQRPQKISRTARRTNFLPIVPSHDDTPTLDTVSEAEGSYNETVFTRHISSSSPQQVKSKGDHTASAASESEESGFAEIKSKYKKKIFDEVDDKVGQNVQKVSSLTAASRKNKMASGYDPGDGIRRKGRTGQGSKSSRSLMPATVERLGGVGTAKQLRTSRIGFDKAESRVGRPPTRKLSDRKAYTRQRVPAPADFVVDGHEEMLAAAKAAVDPYNAVSTSFWRKMEAVFGFISEADINFLKQQGEPAAPLDGPAPVYAKDNRHRVLPSGFSLQENDFGRGSISVMGPYDAVPLWQRLTAALVTEEFEDPVSENEDIDDYTFEAGLELDAKLESGSTSQKLRKNPNAIADATFNGYGVVGGWRSLDKRKECEPNGHLECQYDEMSINERLLMEIQSIGIYLEQPEMGDTDDDEISREIRSSEENYYAQASKKRGLIDMIMKPATEARELQEKYYEQHALDRLVTMAYEKYMACRGKGASNKMARQAALAFVTRTLDCCHKYKDTGASCFSEPLFRDIFRAGPAALVEPQPIDATIDNPININPSPFSNGHDAYASDSPLPSEKDLWANKVKKRELLLDNVGKNPVFNSTSTKGKRSDRDRLSPGNGSRKVGRPASGTSKGERKLKAKPKQKTTQISSSSVDGLLKKTSEQPKLAASDNVKEKDELGFDVLDNPEAMDLGSWLNIEDDGLQDFDLMGLEIPMDDLSDVNMMV